MTDFIQYIILAGGLISVFAGLRSKQTLDILVGLCFVLLAAVQLSHQTGKVIGAIEMVIAVLIITVAALKLRASKRK